MPINNKEALDSKYDVWEANNKEEIVKHINAHHSIYLYSEFGTGKTHFLKWAAKRYHKQGHYVYISMFADINRAIKEEITLRKNGVINKSIESKMKDCKVLCLDDIGNEYMTAYTHELLITIINYRYEHHKATLITSNYSPEELLNIYEKAIGEVKAGQLISRIMTFGVKELEAINYRQKLEY